MKIATPALILAFLLTWATALLTAPEARYPYLAVQAPDGVEVHVLQQALANDPLCQKQLATLRNATLSTCRDCVILHNRCERALDITQSQWLSAAPIGYPSTAHGNDVIVFKSEEAELAQANCLAAASISENTVGAGKLKCYPAGMQRPQIQDNSSGEMQLPPARMIGLIILGGLLVMLTSAMMLFKRQKNAHADAAWPEKVTLASTDALVLTAAFLIVGSQGQISANNMVVHLGLTLLTIGWFWIIKEHYLRRRPFWDELREIFRTLSITLLLASTALLQSAQDTMQSLVVWLCAFALIPLGRANIKGILRKLGLWERPAIIIGTGNNAQEAYRAIRKETNLGYRIKAFAAPAGQTEGPETIAVDGLDFPVIRLNEDPAEQLRDMKGPQVIIGLDSLSPDENHRLVKKLSRLQQNVHIIPTIRGLPLFGTQLSHFFSHEVLFLTVRNNLSRRSYRWAKRIFDFLAASTLLLLLSPLMGYVAFRIWREDGGPVIFKQPRVGLNGELFGFIKFRSMIKNADQVLEQWKQDNSPEWQQYYANNFKLTNDPRVLSVGEWIRGSSIDELPQLINVIRGEMSLVGPRPLLPRELEDYGGAIALYEESRPGLTGLWQISGRSNTTFRERANLDSWYVQNWSLWYDIAILFKTVDVVFNKKGAY